ncbi:hypothetical protein Fot_33872 [Forsythia ovata]|uniref:Uncharacterized protein n=1 Tax=Forsythia ovata TaxID=205694 RepID=A0ABD1TBX0_9LAMI
MDCKLMDMYEWQRREGESQQANLQDRPPQYFSKNLPHTGIEHALPEDFSPRHLIPYQLICNLPCYFRASEVVAHLLSPSLEVHQMMNPLMSHFRSGAYLNLTWSAKQLFGEAVWL